jgi:hypothetical protein
VPVNADLSDLIETLNWLLSNPEETYKIAWNLYIFSLSNSRLEDWVCYMSTALQYITQLTSHIPLLKESIPRHEVYMKSLKRRKISKNKKVKSKFFSSVLNVNRYEFGICCHNKTIYALNHNYNNIDSNYCSY